MTTRTSSLRRRTALALLVLMTGGLPDAMAFKIPYHKQITREVLQGQGFDEDSAEVVADANGGTDLSEASSDAAHADNNMLAPASQRLIQKRTDVGNSLNACRRVEALKAFGQALHTVQDIYSHSNSVDNGHAIPDLLSLSNGTAPCSLPGFAPGGLVTGYFNLTGFFTGNQCRSMPAGMCCHRDLNKDEPEANNGARHGAALDAARGATGTYLQLVEQDVRARFGEPNATQYLKMLKRAQRTTFFVIDTTGSMGSDIAGVKSAVNQFLDQIIAGDEAPTLGLVTFKDNVSDNGPTCDIATLRSQVNALSASGGDDCPEASNSGLLAALGHFPILGSNQQLRGGRILLATDASAGDASLGPLVSIQAALRGVSIDSILTGDCAAEESTFAEAGEDFEPSDNGEEGSGSLAEATEATDPLSSISARTQLRALAEATGGVLFNVARIEVDDVVPTLLELGEPDTAILLSRKVEIASGTPYVLQIPVDDTLTDKVTFMVTASRAGVLPTFTLRRPNGAVVSTTDPDVTYRALSSVKTFAVQTPAVGRWEVRLEGQGTFVVRAFGGTPFRLNNLQLQTTNLDLARPEVEMVPAEGQPVAGDDLVLDAGFTDTPRPLPAVTLRRPDGTLIDELSPAVTPIELLYRSDIEIPAEPFVIETTGLTPAGNEFVRQAAVTLFPQTVALEVAPRASEAAPETTVTLTATVRNVGTAAATFRVRTSSTLGWPASSPAPVAVDAGASATVDIQVQVPAGATEGQRNDITVFAEDVSAPAIRNSALASIVVSANQPPACDGAQASPAALWPPNHGFADVEILGVTDPDGDPVALSVSAITQDEPVDGTGSGDTAPDGEGVGTPTARVRAERSGNGDGRVYAISFTASDGQGGSCAGTVTVGVPHGAKGKATDSGQSYDSTAETP